jgi:hypothetical protein
MHEAIFGGLAGVLLVAWLLAEMRFGTRTRIAIGIACVTSLACAWFVAQLRMVRREAAHEVRAVRDEERLRCIRFCVEIGDIQKVQRLASMPSQSFSEGGGSRIWEEEDEIARQVRALGGWATPCDRLDPLACVFVDFAGNFTDETEVTEPVLQRLGRLPRIGSLCLDGTAAADGWLEHVSRLTQLQCLSLINTKITDAGLEHLRGMTRLRFLCLEGTKVTDVGLEKLSRLERLRTLDLSGTGVTDEGVKRLQKSLPNCKIER